MALPTLLEAVKAVDGVTVTATNASDSFMLDKKYKENFEVRVRSGRFALWKEGERMMRQWKLKFLIHLRLDAMSV
jgi:hypothetical protein